MGTGLDFEGPIKEIEKTLKKLRKQQEEKHTIEVEQQIRELEESLRKHRDEIYAKLTPWQTVKVARHWQRPVFKDYIGMIFTDFIELHGDRTFSDDRALIGGFAFLGRQAVMLVGHNKGKDVHENIRQNFGMARPEGYRKALRLMKLAEKYNIPVITFIDTAGAFPGVDAEERGQAEAIARNLYEMSQFTVPIITVVTGEGGSGGALGIGVADAIIMLSNSIYSVISPEGCASILWRDAEAHSSTAADALKLTATSLLELGIIDEIVEEPLGGAHSDAQITAVGVKKAIQKHLKRLKGYSASKLVHKRFEKYSNMGIFNT